MRPVCLSQGSLEFFKVEKHHPRGLIIITIIRTDSWECLPHARRYAKRLTYVFFFFLNLVTSLPCYSPRLTEETAKGLDEGRDLLRSIELVRGRRDPSSRATPPPLRLPLWKGVALSGSRGLRHQSGGAHDAGEASSGLASAQWVCSEPCVQN